MRAYFFIADKNFAEIAVAQAARIVRLTQDDVHLFLEGLGEGNRFKEFPSPRIHYHYDRLASLLPKGLPVTNRFRLINYNRIVAPLLLGNYQRVVYLDADVFFLQPNDAIWEVDLPHGIGAVHDLCLVGDLTVHRDRPKTVWLDSLGINSSRYFNAGILAIDPKKWGEVDLISRLASFASKYRDQMLFMDQDFLNHEFQERWTELSPRFNFQFPIHGLGYATKLKPSFIHFNTGDKPWHGRWRTRYTPLGQTFLQLYAASLHDAGYSIDNVQRRPGYWFYAKRFASHLRRHLWQTALPNQCFWLAHGEHKRTQMEMSRFFSEAHANRRFADLDELIEPSDLPLVYCGLRFQGDETEYWNSFFEADRPALRNQREDQPALATKPA